MSRVLYLLPHSRSASVPIKQVIGLSMMKLRAAINARSELFIRVDMDAVKLLARRQLDAYLSSHVASAACTSMNGRCVDHAEPRCSLAEAECQGTLHSRLLSWLATT
ncbi:hypothetical protein BAUCODRAFT_121034 [Baudoinia panamericana UAMH 10762]|uniref:Uncharacterized protein n=1 Tax=Baudoinia panamericana (strain UAMH 10762) TaxID=717646 RepID=M2NFU6_BAUPA|nr:uncharacterized protein BAUCODRAFT_121034 [Baudoinia panamericana UAMH 10762]EMC98139.1 hypothetical protein BAUCODRAFT_121034 [Baudoinia panamericana UAMH 10762]